jgi:hypothetical protein
MCSQGVLTALMKPSQAPAGLFMKVCQIGKIWRPFIMLPSYPLADENWIRDKRQKLSFNRPVFLYHGLSVGKTAANSWPTFLLLA